MCWGTSGNLKNKNLGEVWYFIWQVVLVFGGSQAANDCNLEPVAYEFFTQAYILYEEEITVIFLFSIVMFFDY